jgi:hypothetical protein
MTTRWLILSLAFALVLPASTAAKNLPPSPKVARAWQALQKEFDKVARTREKEVRKKALEVLLAIREWRVEALIEECTVYGPGKDGRELTRKFFAEEKEAWQTAARFPDVDEPTFAQQLQFGSPEPEAGMPGRVNIPFGPKPVEKKKNAVLHSDPQYPERYELELWWSGPLMPEANGPVRATAPAGSKPGRWRLHRIVKPYSLTYLPRL